MVSRLRQSHSFTFSKVYLDILKFSFHHSTKFPFKRVSNQNWFLGHDHVRLTRLVLQRAIWSRVNRFRLDLFRYYKRKSCCNLDSWVCRSRTRKQNARAKRVTASLLNPPGGGYLTKFNMGRLRPEVQPLTLSYTILAEKLPLLSTSFPGSLILPPGASSP